MGSAKSIIVAVIPIHNQIQLKEGFQYLGMDVQEYFLSCGIESVHNISGNILKLYPVPVTFLLYRDNIAVLMFHFPCAFW